MKSSNIFYIIMSLNYLFVLYSVLVYNCTHLPTQKVRTRNFRLSLSYFFLIFNPTKLSHIYFNSFQLFATSQLVFHNTEGKKLLLIMTSVHKILRKCEIYFYFTCRIIPDYQNFYQYHSHFAC